MANEKAHEKDAHATGLHTEEKHDAKAEKKDEKKKALEFPRLMWNKDGAEITVQNQSEHDEQAGKGYGDEAPKVEKPEDDATAAIKAVKKAEASVK